MPNASANIQRPSEIGTIDVPHAVLVDIRPTGLSACPDEQADDRALNLSGSIRQAEA